MHNDIMKKLKVTMMNKRIEIAAKKLKLRVIEYNGFVRGKIWDGESSHCGAWEFQTLPEHETEEEPMCVFAFNIKDALAQMKTNAEYFHA